jgi:NTP pyrophosphatase (non-canonical NTP hydrolase)
MYSLEQMRVEHREWAMRNFGDTHNGLAAMCGAVEEVGELAHGYLKKYQGIRGTAEEHDAAMRDAIGDITVYLMEVFSVHGINPDQARLRGVSGSTSSEWHLIYELASEVGMVGLINESGVKATEQLAERLGDILSLLDIFCQRHGWNFDEIVEKTWEHVKTRDWKKDPESGGTADTDAQVHAGPLEDPDDKAVDEELARPMHADGQDDEYRATL